MTDLQMDIEVIVVTLEPSYETNLIGVPAARRCGVEDYFVYARGTLGERRPAFLE